MGKLYNFVKVEQHMDDKLVENVCTAIQEFGRQIAQKLKDSDDIDISYCAKNIGDIYVKKCKNARFMVLGDDGNTQEYALCRNCEDVKFVCRTCYAGTDIFDDSVRYEILDTLREILVEVATFMFFEEALENVFDEVCEVSMEVAANYCETILFE